MQVHRTAVDGMLLFAPRPGALDSFDADVAHRHGVDPLHLVRDSSIEVTVPGGVHGLDVVDGAMLVRCTHGSVYDVVVDARPHSRTFGRVATFLLDAAERRRLYVPAGCLHGFQALGGPAETRLRHEPAQRSAPEATIRVDDPDLAVRWPLPVVPGPHDRTPVRWADLCGRLGAEVPERSCSVGW